MPVRQLYQHQRVQGVKVGRFNHGINTQFIVYRMGSTVIDAGPSNQWRHVAKFLKKEPVKQLLLTHHHEDHSGNAQRIAKLFSITPKAPKLAQAKLATGYPTPLLQKIVWGSPRPVHTLNLADTEFLEDATKVIPVHTPGHAKDLTCFHVPSEGYFFSGDLYIAKTIKMLRKDEDLIELINSLRKVQQLDFTTLFCPHGGIIQDGKQALQLKLNNILQLCSEVKELAEKGWPIDQIAQYLLGPEDATAKLTNGNFSKTNLIKQCALMNL